MCLLAVLIMVWVSWEALIWLSNGYAYKVITLPKERAVELVKENIISKYEYYIKYHEALIMTSIINYESIYQAKSNGIPTNNLSKEYLEWAAGIEIQNVKVRTTSRELLYLRILYGYHKYVHMSGAFLVALAICLSVWRIAVEVRDA